MSNKDELVKYFPEEMVNKYLKDKNEITIYKGKGCPICNQTGYNGRIGIFEILVVSEAIKKLITEKVDSNVIQDKAKEEGMVTMMENGLLKVQQGLTTIEEIVRISEE